LNLPFNMGYDTGYTYFYREDGTRGHRADIHPRLYLPYQFGRYLSLESSLGLQETIWDVGHQDVLSENKDHSFNRELYDIRFDISSEIYRVYQTGANPEDRIKHIMRLQAVYDYIPELNQSRFPQFDMLDRIQNRDMITYSWTHSFVSKSVSPQVTGEKPETPEYGYHQFARLKFEQSYDIYKNDNKLPEPFSPIFTELEVEVIPMVSLKGDTGWSTYNSEFVSHNIACKLFDLRGDEFFIERRYAKDARETIYTDIMLQIAPWLWLYGDFERNILAKKDLAKGVGVSFQARCWSFDVHFSKEQNDNQVAFSISLFGLGDFGSSGRKPRIANYIDALRSTRDSDRWQPWGMRPGMRE
jgi:LPS-assembly protein